MSQNIRSYLHKHRIRFKRQSLAAMNHLLVVTCLAGCGGLSAAPKGQNAVAMSGKIDEKSVTTVLAIMRSQSHIDALIVTSGGGNAIFAMALGREIKSRHMRVLVQGLCASSCAQYILPAADSVGIADGSLIAFHSSPTGMYDVLSASKSRGAKTFETAVDLERSYYKKLGVDPRVSHAIAVMMEPLCIKEQLDAPLNSPFHYAVGWRRSAVVLTDNQMKRFGINVVKGRLPTADRIPAVERDLGFSRRFNPYVFPLDSEFEAALAAPISPVASCVASSAPVTLL